MKWLTQKQVKAHATTKTKALNISIKHWQQIVDATKEEIMEYFSKEGALTTPELCGLCMYRNQDCKTCLLGGKYHSCDVPSQYGKVDQLANRLQYNEYVSTFRDFKKEARKMLKLLKSLKGKK